ncbi:hypothetical protein F9L07_25800 [Pimelobacter simplex]|uniref:Uncharacterized protein n=1 Tax=Nocardioides simplex TaxID=2045 RepID=A0A7J5DRG3_NOCSI|nr:hypothetical protein F9L07_25800 [Pimelobacter simplex]
MSTALRTRSGTSFGRVCPTSTPDGGRTAYRRRSAIPHSPARQTRRRTPGLKDRARTSLGSLTSEASRTSSSTTGATSRTSSHHSIG